MPDNSPEEDHPLRNGQLEKAGLAAAGAGEPASQDVVAFRGVTAIFKYRMAIVRLCTYLTLPYPTLTYPTLPYPTLPYPTLPYPTLP